MQLWNLLHAACWKHRTQNVAKNHHLGTISQLCRAISSQLRHVSTIGKKNLLSNNEFSTCPHNMLNFGPLTAEIYWPVWGTPSKFQRPSRLGSVTAHRQPNFVALNRGRHLCSAGRPSRWALATFLVSSCFFLSSFFPRLVSAVWP